MKPEGSAQARINNDPLKATDDLVSTKTSENSQGRRSKQKDTHTRLQSAVSSTVYFKVQINKGNLYLPSILQRLAIVPPSIIALIISAAILSKRSAPRAAQSPTLSPTLNGIISRINVKLAILTNKSIQQNEKMS